MTPRPEHPAEPPAPAPPSALRAALEDRLDAAGRAWLDRALTEAAAKAAAPAEPAAHSAVGSVAGDGAGERATGSLSRWERAFAMAGRRCRAAAHRSAAPPTAGAPRPPQDPHPPEDTARVLLLHAAQPPAEAVVRLYQRGSAAERRAVLRALPHLDLGPAADALVDDALRANDTRLITAAVGPGAAERLPAHAWRHALLKCLFTGVPITAVAGLRRRVPGDGELLRMLTDYAAERTAAGRPVPDDLLLLRDLAGPHAADPDTAGPHPPSTTGSRLPTPEES